jgi:uncharacterized membrane protein YsdA (DUF1294 family)/cold shock CspA family protein
MIRNNLTEDERAMPKSSGSSEQHGVVVKYDADRGFGFIRPDGAPDGSSRDIFVHVSEVEGRKNLRPGQRVTYRVTQSEKGPAAVAVRPGSVLGAPYLLFGLIGLGLAAAILVGLILTIGKGQPLKVWAALWVVALSIAAFFIYGFDKSQAQRGGLRVPEAILHLLSLLGGSPGAFVAMRVFHHKTSKRSFQAVFWLIAAAQLVVLAYLLLR